MTDKEQRPQYGEYATPQDQAAAMGKSYGGTGLSEPPASGSGAKGKKRSADKTSTDKTSTDKTSTDKRSANKTSADKRSADKRSADKTSAGGRSADKHAAGSAKADTASPQEEAAGRQPRLWDAILTAVLVGIGVSFVLYSIPQFADLYDGLNALSAEAGGAPYTSREVADSVGFALNLGQIAILLLTIVWAVRALRAGRLAFYIPILGGIAGFVLVVVLFAVAIAGDPAFMDSLQPS